ncbi:MAG: hypothetical protein ACFCVD_05515 [Nodosilinea sp.]
MTIPAFIPAIAAVLFVLFLLYASLKGEFRWKHMWVLPAVLSLLFLLLSLWAVVTEGAFGFWTEHTRNLWGNQIWLDLLLAVGIAWVLIVPQARAFGMPLLPWLTLVLSTGCIGFLAMMARLLYLRENSGLSEQSIQTDV